MGSQGTLSNTVRLLQPEDRSSLKAFTASYRFRPYYYYEQINERRLSEFFYRDLCAGLGQGSVYGRAIEDEITGVLIFDYLAWDSQLFGIPMAKVDLYVNGNDYREAFTIASQLLEVMDALSRDKKIRHLACKVNTLEVPTLHALERCAFRLMDTLTVFSVQPNRMSTDATEVKTDLRLREMRDEDVPTLSALSRKAFTTTSDILTRFTSDPLLMDKAGDLYAQWLENSYRGDQADIVFVAEVDQRPIGFITCRLSSAQADDVLGKRVGSIPLNAVDPEFRRLGVYTQLVATALDWFRAQRVDYVEIRTQIHTLGTHRTWQRLNGKLVSSYHVLHRSQDGLEGSQARP